MSAVAPCASAPDAASPAGNRALRIALLLVACLVYVGIALTSPGYDDEFYNIALIDSGRPLSAVLAYTQHWDVLPPGQYVLDALLHALLGSWSLARAAGALFCALVLVRFAGLERRDGAGMMLLHFALVVLHPTLLMWCTGLRWSTWLVPVFLLAILWIRRDTSSRWHFWPVLAALSLALLYLHYTALLLVPLLVLLAVYRRRERLRQEWPAILIAGLAATPFALFQLWFLLAYQIHIGSVHDYVTGVRGAAFAGVALGLMVHAGVFPVSILGIATLAVFALLATRLGWRHRALLARDPELWLIVGAVLLMVATGLSGKPRDLVMLVPLVFARIVPLLERTPDRIGLVLAWLLATSNLAGTVNVARHADTVKGSWNLPVTETIAAVRAAAANCGAATPVIAALDPVLAGNLAAHTPYVVIPARPLGAPMPMVRDGDYCLLQVRTARGSIPGASWAAIQRRFPAPIAPPLRIGPDPDIAAKRLVDPDLPDHYVELVAYGRMRRVPDYLNLIERRRRGVALGRKAAFD